MFTFSSHNSLLIISLAEHKKKEKLTVNEYTNTTNTSLIERIENAFTIITGGNLHEKLARYPGLVS